jgi:cbb3-type cytochrome oxidase maturation protein
MSVLIFLIPIALSVGLIALACFLWTLKNKQYEDMEGAASRILFDEEDEDEVDSKSDSDQDASSK